MDIKLGRCKMRVNNTGDKNEDKEKNHPSLNDNQGMNSLDWEYNEGHKQKLKQIKQWKWNKERSNNGQ